MKEDYCRKLSPKLLKDTQEAKKHIPYQGHLCRSTGAAQVKTSDSAFSYLRIESAALNSDGKPVFCVCATAYLTSCSTKLVDESILYLCFLFYKVIKLS